MEPLLTFPNPLLSGELIDRPNRFVVTVRFDSSPERVFLADPGALKGVIHPGREVICSPADDPDRKTAYDAIAIKVEDLYVSVRAAFANELVEAAISNGLLPAFERYRILEREPALPDHGRTDFRLETPSGHAAFVEVKSCTHVENGIAKFPDRQTERGRRHLESLASLVKHGREAHVVFVVQRADAETFRPYRSVDPDFADLLEQVSEAGVEVHAMSTAFDPPTYSIADPVLPIVLTG